MLEGLEQLALMARLRGQKMTGAAVRRRGLLRGIILGKLNSLFPYIFAHPEEDDPAQLCLHVL